jgi:hypothetical protein
MNRHAFGSLILALALALPLAQPRPALAWGDDGHKVVALVAQSFLDSDVRRKVTTLLAADTDSLTAHDIASAATWADKYRDANIDNSRERTRQWHFADIEIRNPDLSAACFSFHGRPASDGPEDDCVVNKIEEFKAELANPATDLEEQVVALKFILHFVGDVHQPLHSSDDHDHGGNQKRVSAPGFRANNLHHYWDTEFVNELGQDPKSIASDLIEHISRSDVQQWAAGKPADWANETFDTSKKDAYGQLPPPNSRGSFRLNEDYVTTATGDVATQLGKAGVRLAFILNQALKR